MATDITLEPLTFEGSTSFRVRRFRKFLYLSATDVTSWQPGLLSSSATASNNSGAGSNIQFVSDSTAALIQFGATFMLRRSLFKITVLQDGDIALLVSVSMACWAWTTTLFSTMNSETQAPEAVSYVCPAQACRFECKPFKLQ